MYNAFTATTLSLRNDKRLKEKSARRQIGIIKQAIKREVALGNHDVSIYGSRITQKSIDYFKSLYYKMVYIQPEEGESGSPRTIISW